MATRSDAGADREFRRAAGWSLLRSLVTAAVILAAYFVLPLEPPADASALTRLLVGLVVLVLVLVWQIHAIVRSAFPRARAIGALVTSVPLFFVVFAATYEVMQNLHPGSFSEPMTRVDGLYFTVTVFSTVGFGDIVPLTQPARVAVMTQMLADLAVLGVVARAFLTAIQRGLARRAGTSDDRRD